MNPSSTGGSQPPVLQLTDVTKTYPGTPPVHAVRGVSITVNPGEMFAIVGQSGSGKSTLLNLAGALDRPSSGTVRIDGQDVSLLSDAALSSLRGRRVGFVFQQFVLIDELTALANVTSGLIYRGIPAAEREDRAMAALERVGIAHRAGHRPGELSGGEQQRVAIGRAIVGEPALVLADEPTGNLDSTTGRQLVQMFRDLHDDGATIGVITHDLSLAETMPRQVSMRDGQVESDSGKSDMA